MIETLVKDTSGNPRTSLLPTQRMSLFVKFSKTSDVTSVAVEFLVYERTTNSLVFKQSGNAISGSSSEGWAEIKGIPITLGITTADFIAKYPYYRFIARLTPTPGSAIDSSPVDFEIRSSGATGSEINLGFPNDGAEINDEAGLVFSWVPARTGKYKITISEQKDYASANLILHQFVTMPNFSYPNPPSSLNPKHFLKINKTYWWQIEEVDFSNQLTGLKSQCRSFKVKNPVPFSVAKKKDARIKSISNPFFYRVMGTNKMRFFLTINVENKGEVNITNLPIQVITSWAGQPISETKQIPSTFKILPESQQVYLVSIKGGTAVAGYGIDESKPSVGIIEIQPIPTGNQTATQTINMLLAGQTSARTFSLEFPDSFVSFKVTATLDYPDDNIQNNTFNLTFNSEGKIEKKEKSEDKGKKQLTGNRKFVATVERQSADWYSLITSPGLYYEDEGKESKCKVDKIVITCRNKGAESFISDVTNIIGVKVSNIIGLKVKGVSVDYNLPVSQGEEESVTIDFPEGRYIPNYLNITIDNKNNLEPTKYELEIKSLNSVPQDIERVYVNVKSPGERELEAEKEEQKKEEKSKKEKLEKGRIGGKIIFGHNGSRWLCENMDCYIKGRPCEYFDVELIDAKTERVVEECPSTANGTYLFKKVTSGEYRIRASGYYGVGWSGESKKFSFYEGDGKFLDPIEVKTY